jgi:endonuclease/exonuclease/phosphatase (EEP) superfamily protein YafD
MVMHWGSDWHPLLELSTHFSMHLLGGACGVLGFLVAGWLYRRSSPEARRPWQRRLGWLLIPTGFYLWVVAPWRFLPQSVSEESSGRPIKVLAWNVLLTNSDPSQAIRLIEEHQPDIVLLIEVNPKFEKAMRSVSQRYPATHSSAVWNAGGMLVLSRFPDTTFRTLHPGDTWMPAIEACFSVADPKQPLPQRYAILGVHTFSPKLFQLGRTSQRDQQLKSLAEWSKARGEPAMVIGDLNVTPWSPPFWRLLLAGRLRDSAWQQGYFPSWPAVLGRWGIPIDHALVHREIQVLQRRNLYFASDSDHLPLLITFTQKRKS